MTHCRACMSNYKRIGSVLRKIDTSIFKCSVSHLLLSRSSYSTNDALDEKPQIKSLLENSAAFEDKNPSTDVWTSPVYPVLTKRSQPQHSIRPQIDPRKTSVILFPGQGTQYVGMAKKLISYPNVQEMFDTASEILKYNLFDLCVNGPVDMLNMTEHCQAAIMVASLAAVEKLQVDNPMMIETCVATAGFSVGEYAALVFAGALGFEDAVRLLKIRGEAMQAASELVPSGMMTAFLKPTAKIKYACNAAREWCKSQNIEDAECKVAIYLFPDCKVISGHMEALKFLELNASEFGIKKIKYIPVSGAFHSKLMKPAKEVLQKALNNIHFDAPLIPVHSNVDGKAYSNANKIRENLAKQLCSSVAWEQTMHIVFERTSDTPFPDIFECGPGQTLKMILKYNNAKAHDRCSCIKA